jgi:nucleoid DNA-binding protein
MQLKQGRVQNRIRLVSGVINRRQNRKRKKAMEEEKKKHNRKISVRQPDHTRPWLVKQLADKAGFYQRDVDVLLDALEEVLSEMLAKEEILSVHGLFTVYLTKRKAGKYFNNYEQELKDTPESYYASFKASKQLLKYIPGSKSYKEDKAEDI